MAGWGGVEGEGVIRTVPKLKLILVYYTELSGFFSVKIKTVNKTADWDRNEERVQILAVI